MALSLRSPVPALELTPHARATFFVSSWQTKVSNVYAAGSPGRVRPNVETGYGRFGDRLALLLSGRFGKCFAIREQFRSLQVVEEDYRGQPKCGIGDLYAA
jgi:hypothetical protein